MHITSWHMKTRPLNKISLKFTEADCTCPVHTQDKSAFFLRPVEGLEGSFEPAET